MELAKFEAYDMLILTNITLNIMSELIRAKATKLTSHYMEHRI